MTRYPILLAMSAPEMVEVAELLGEVSGRRRVMSFTVFWSRGHATGYQPWSPRLPEVLALCAQHGAVVHRARHIPAATTYHYTDDDNLTRRVRCE